MGFRPEIIAELGNLGPDYLKVDSLYTQNLTTNQVNRSVLTSFSGVARSLGIPCIAEGISTTEDVSEAFNLGARGVSGEAVGLGAPDSEY
jgi:EAL domain-containing protein (putative c-di-GMP-specific phosphodiesterase class I)